MAFTSTLTPTPAADKGIPYTWFTTLLANTNDINDRAWTAYTPTWTNGTLGNGVLEGKYWRLGKLVVVRIDLIWGSTTSSSGAWSFSLPVSAVATRSYSVSMGEYVDASPSSSGDIRARLTAATTITVLSGATQLNTTSPITWTTSDEMHLIGIYEAA